MVETVLEGKRHVGIYYRRSKGHPHRRSFPLTFLAPWELLLSLLRRNEFLLSYHHWFKGWNDPPCSRLSSWVLGSEYTGRTPSRLPRRIPVSRRGMAPFEWHLPRQRFVDTTTLSFQYWPVFNVERFFFNTVNRVYFCNKGSCIRTLSFGDMILLKSKSTHVINNVISITPGMIFRLC